MNRRDAAAEVKERISCLDYLTPSKGRLYCCPFCQSGMHGAGSDGALEYFSDSNRYKCHACGEHGTVIDLYMADRGIDSFSEAVDELAASIGIQIDGAYRAPAAEDFDDIDAPVIRHQTHTTPRATPLKVEQPTTPPADYTEYLMQAAHNLETSPEAQEYITGRCISLNTARMYGLGFDPAWVSPTVANNMDAQGKSWRPAPKPVLIIPSGKSHYVARDIRPRLDADGKKYSKMNEGKPEIMGEAVLYSDGVDHVFVTEGAFDALSIIECGEHAIALNSTSNADMLIRHLQERPTAARLILCLDNDDPGRSATRRLIAALQRLNIPYVDADISSPHKDPNEHLQADRAGFVHALTKAATETPDAPQTETHTPLTALATPPADYTEYLRQCIETLAESDRGQRLLSDNGLSMDVAEYCSVGYDPDLDALIVPTTTRHYVAVAADGTMNHTGKPEIMGEPVIYSGADYVYVFSRPLPALAVIECGKAAVAVYDMAGVDRLLKLLDQRPTPATLILCIGGDSRQNKAAERLRQGLRRLNVSCLDAPTLNGDLNAMLRDDRDALDAVLLMAANTRPDNVSLYIDSLMGSDLQRRQEIGVKPTGLKNLDEAIHGGLRPGLYMIGAISSLGKTTFCSQIADGLAENGADVLYFSLEQSRLEMVSKSLAREMAKTNIKLATSSGAIMDNRLSNAQRALLAECIESYKAKVGERISVIEAGFNADTKFITDYVRQYVERTGKRPVVVIDYLQVLKSGELANRKGAGTREQIEEVIGQLVLLKRDLDLTVLCIVSLNRASYQQKFDFESMKESGLTEYSADVVWGLQLRVLDEPLFEKDKDVNKKREEIRKAKAAIPRRVKLIALKHRGQNGYYECNFDYRPQFDLFTAAPN